MPAPTSWCAHDLGTDHVLSRSERSCETAELLAAAAKTSDPAEIDRLLGRVVLINRGVAEAVAGRYARRGIPIEDLRQVATEGLIKAVHRYDPALRNDLLTFAVPTIRGELQRYFRDHGWTIRPPRRIQEIQGQSARTTEILERRLGREPTDAEVADDIGVGHDQYRSAMASRGCFQPTSLDLLAGGEGSQRLGDLLPDEDRQFDAAEARVTLAPAIGRLPERDRRILYLRYFQDMTQKEIGADIGVTQMQISRLLNRILSDLRENLDPPA